MFNYQNLIEVYKTNLKDSDSYLKTRSTHWDEWYSENKNFKFLKSIKKNLLKITYKIITKILLLSFGKNKIRKISKIFLNISNK